MTKQQRYRISDFVSELSKTQRKQDRGALKTHEGYCPLGIACVTYQRMTGKENFILNEYSDRYSFLGAESYLPKRVQEFFGLAPDPLLITDSGSMIKTTYANDECKMTFAEIGQLFKRTYLDKQTGGQG
jgi:hypothetical protein